MKKTNILIMAIIACLMISLVTATYVLEAKIEVQLLNQNPDPVEPGKYVEIRWKVENNGGEATEDVIFEITPKYPFSLDPGADPLQKLGKLDSYQVGDDAYVVFYRVKVDQNAVDGQYDLEYRFSTGSNTWREGSDSIRVEDSDYNIGLMNVKTIPSKTAPGQDVKINFNIENFAASEITNVIVTLTVEKIDTATTSITRTELPFTPLGTSDKVVIDMIKVGEAEEVEFNLAVDADAQSKVHKIPVTVTYSNNQGTSYTKEFIVGIPVFEKPEYLLNLENTEIYKSSQKGKVVASISNTGMGQINFLTITLEPSEDYHIISADKIYLGNLDSDDFETADFEIYVKSDKDDVPLNLKLDYKDEYNNKYNDKKSVSVPLYSREDALKFGFEKPRSYTGTIIFVLIIIVAGIWYWRRKKRRRRVK